MRQSESLSRKRRQADLFSGLRCAQRKERAQGGISRPGAVLPGGQVINKLKIRGQISSECFYRNRSWDGEIDREGIYIFSDATLLNKDVNEFVKKEHEVLDVELTADRPDLSVYTG